MIAFSEVYKKFPACCIGAWDGKDNTASLIFAVDHELTMYAEDQDGCITAKEANECRRFIVWLRLCGINTAAVLRGED